MARYDDLNTNAIAYTTFISCVLLVIIILLVQTLCFNWLNSHEDMRVSRESYVSSDENLAKQRATLDGYHWVDVPAPLAPGETPKPDQPVKMIKKLQIPIERAAQLLLNELKPAEAVPKT